MKNSTPRVKRSEHEKKAKEFHRLMAIEAKKPPAEQNFPDDGEWPTVDAHVTCSTPSCAGYGNRVAVTLHENADGVYRAICGHCNKPMTIVLDLDEG